VDTLPLDDDYPDDDDQSGRFLLGPTSGQNFLVSGTPDSTIDRKSNSPVQVSGTYVAMPALRGKYMVISIRTSQLGCQNGFSIGYENS